MTNRKYQLSTTTRWRNILLASVVLPFVVAACATQNMLVYSSGFNFAKYQNIVVAKPDGQNTGAALYGLDVELANLLTRYNMKIIGNNQYPALSPLERSKTLFARMSLEAVGKKRIILTVSFDDMVTGVTGASITTYAKGDLWDLDSRTEVFQDASQEIVNAIQHDKGLTVTGGVD